MMLDEAIKHCEEVADLCEYEASKYDMSDSYESHVACQEGKCAEEHRQLAEWLKELKMYREMIPSAKWLKNHFDIERTIICGAQQPCEDAISRQVAIDALREAENHAFNSYYQGLKKAHKIIANLPPVILKPQEPRTGYISIDDVMSVFDDFMCGEVDGDGTDTFLEMLKDKAESDHKCHNCKHYVSGQRDGSCGSYICKNYSGWESEDKDADSN